MPRTVLGLLQERWFRYIQQQHFITRCYGRSQWSMVLQSQVAFKPDDCFGHFLLTLCPAKKFEQDAAGLSLHSPQFSQHAADAAAAYRFDGGNVQNDGLGFFGNPELLMGFKGVPSSFG